MKLKVATFSMESLFARFDFAAFADEARAHRGRPKRSPSGASSRTGFPIRQRRTGS